MMNKFYLKEFWLCVLGENQILIHIHPSGKNGSGFLFNFLIRLIHQNPDPGFRVCSLKSEPQNIQYTCMKARRISAL